MRKKEAIAIIITLLLGMTAGCAPGDISRYTARAQQAGKEIFEGETAPALAESGTAAEPGSETESGAEESGETVTNTGAEPETEALEADGAAETENTAGADEAQEAEQPELPAMMEAADERIREAVAQKAEAITGKLAGADVLSQEEQEALRAVLDSEVYDDSTLCLINSGRFDGQTEGSFLLFFDSTSLTARGKVSGELWFYGGKKAVKIMGEADFMRLEPIQCGGGTYMLSQIETDEKVIAQVYRVEEGKAAACFTGAVSIEQEGDELRVNYKADHIQYDPAKGWSGGEAEITYFYVPDGGNFAQISIREMTAEQYLAYIQPDENDAEEIRFEQEQKEKFYDTQQNEQEYRYSFFAIGDDRIGYRECRIGFADEDADENGHEVAEYRYCISKLEDGKLTQQCETLSGSGYYFGDWKQKEEELQKLSQIPPMYLKYRIDRAEQTLGTKEKTALQCIQKVQAYGADGLCFMQQADYDGDGETETFAAIGRYDGAFGAPVCDLWFVSGEDPVLLAENLPVKSAFCFESGDTTLFLLEGYAVEGRKDRLYCVTEGKTQRCLENAAEIEIEENGDLMARMADEAGEMPRYYHVQDGQVREYGAEEIDPKAILDYENGKALDRRLQKTAEAMGGEWSCMRRENGLIHILFTDKDGSVSYETYRVQEKALVLTDCGEGGCSLGLEKAAVTGETEGTGETEETEETEETQEAEATKETEETETAKENGKE